MTSVSCKSNPQHNITEKERHHQIHNKTNQVCTFSGHDTGKAEVKWRNVDITCFHGILQQQAMVMFHGYVISTFNVITFDAVSYQQM